MGPSDCSYSGFCLSLPATGKTNLPSRMNSLTVCVVCPTTDLFSLFASESGGYAARDDMEAVLRALDGEVPPSLRKCFSEVSHRLLSCHLSITQTDTLTDAQHTPLSSPVITQSAVRSQTVCLHNTPLPRIQYH